MNYQESIEYLKSLTTFGINLGLGRIKNLLSRLGSPEKELNFVHVAGTNGKGSTCAMLASILDRSGLKVGLFTSPHIHSYTERIRINGREIREDEISQLITEIRVPLDEMVREGVEHPTEFGHHSPCFVVFCQAAGGYCYSGGRLGERLILLMLLCPDYLSLPILGWIIWIIWD